MVLIIVNLLLIFNWFLTLYAQQIQYQPLYLALRNSKLKSQKDDSSSEEKVGSKKVQITYQPLLLALLQDKDIDVDSWMQFIDNNINEINEYIPSWKNTQNSESDEKPDNEKQNLDEKKTYKNYIPSYEKFEKVYPYIKYGVKAASFVAPGAAQYKQIMFGIDMAKISWKAADMHKNGESWSDIAYFVGKEAVLSLGRRGATDSSNLKLDIFDGTFEDKLSIEDTKEFFQMIKNIEYSSAEKNEDNYIKNEVTKSVNKHLAEYFKEGVDKNKFIDLICCLVKYITFRVIIPTFGN